VKMLLDGVRASDPQVIDDLTAAGVTTGEVQRVLAGLLNDGIPIRDLVRILEAVGERARVQHTAESLIEAARAELGAAITSSLAVDGRLYAIILAPSSESRLLSGLRSIDGATQLELLPSESDALVAQLSALNNEMNLRNTPAVLVCSGPVRSALSGLVKLMVPGLGVVSYAEIGDHLEIEVVGNVDISADNVLTSQPTAVHI